MTLAYAVKKVMDEDSGRSPAAATDPDHIAAERRHPKAAYLRCRPQADAANENLMAAKRPSPSRIEAAAEPVGSALGTFWLWSMSERAPGSGSGCPSATPAV